jgi:helix-turn-helix protein
LIDIRQCIICKHRELTPDRPQVCTWCQRLMDRQLRLVERAAPLLEVVASSEPTRAGQLDLTAVDLATPGYPRVYIGTREDRAGHKPAAARLAFWAEDWSGRPIWSADAVSIAAFLRRGLRWACASHPGVDEFARELRGLYAELRRALHRDLSGHRYAAPCPHCGHRTLIRYPGADWIECGPCEALYDEGDYATIVLAEIPGYALVTAQEAAQIAGVTPDTVYKWVERGKLRPDIGPWGGRRFYRRSDVDAIWTRSTVRARERVMA